LDEAIKPIQAPLATSLWVDNNHLVTKGGQEGDVGCDIDLSEQRPHIDLAVAHAGREVGGAEWRLPSGKEKAVSHHTKRHFQRTSSY
jgi:hypothetical protein